MEFSTRNSRISLTNFALWPMPQKKPLWLFLHTFNWVTYTLSQAFRQLQNRNKNLPKYTLRVQMKSPPSPHAPIVDGGIAQRTVRVRLQSRDLVYLKNNMQPLMLGGNLCLRGNSCQIKKLAQTSTSDVPRRGTNRRGRLGRLHANEILHGHGRKQCLNSHKNRLQRPRLEARVARQ